MRYAKPPLTIAAHADQLLAWGLCGDRTVLISRLATVNYYRLSGYWHPFREAAGDGFRPNTKLDDVWARYAFGRGTFDYS